MEIFHDDDDSGQLLDQAGISFMVIMIHKLNKALKQQNVDNPQHRQEICGRVLFDLAYNFDAGWIMQGEKKLFPKVCFAERAIALENENLGEISELHVPTQAISWHEYAGSLVAEYFEDDQEAKPNIRTGSYDIEN